MILGCILLNSLLFMLNWYDQSPELVQKLEICNQVLSVIFLVEAAIKITGYGKAYFLDWQNNVDFFICLISIVDIILTYATSGDMNNSIQIIRILRLVRIIRIAKTFKLTRRINILSLFFNTFMSALPSLASLGMLLLLVLYLFAVVGTYLFSTVGLQATLNEKANF